MKNNPAMPTVKKCLCIAFIRGFLTIFYRAIAGINLDFTKWEILQIVGIVLNTFYSTLSLFAFLMFYLRDTRMKLFMQE